MSDLSIKGRVLRPTQVSSLPADRSAEKIARLGENGADDVVVRVGDELKVASGRGLALRGVKPGDAVTLDGKAGQVVQVDRQMNTFGEGMLAWPGLAVGGVGAAWGLVGFAQGVLAGANMAGLGLIIAAGALVAGAAINVVPAIWAATRKVDA